MFDQAAGKTHISTRSQQTTMGCGVCVCVCNLAHGNEQNEKINKIGY